MGPTTGEANGKQASQGEGVISANEFILLASLMEPAIPTYPRPARTGVATLAQAAIFAMLIWTSRRPSAGVGASSS